MTASLSYARARVVKSSWLEESGRRLDCNPYMSGALEARDALRSLKAPKEPLRTLTSGHAGGIFNGPVFARQWVENRQFGVPFLGSSDMMNADLSTLPLLRKAYAESPRLRHLAVKPGMTLITCSGTIGRMVYVRAEMAGMWSSQHVMKVVPDESKIPSGYLYAFLSSSYGVPLVVSGTYGAIIQHIEPEHIATLPVPRFGGDAEQEVHVLIESAAEARSLAALSVREGIAYFLGATKLGDPSDRRTSASFSFGAVSTKDLMRMDATYFSPYARTSSDGLRAPQLNPRRLGECARVFTPGIFKRMYVDDPAWGYAYYSGSELFEHSPRPRGYLSRRAPNIDDYLIKKDWLLIQDAGQVGGLIGRVTRAQRSVDGSVVSNHLMRVAASSREESAYIFAVLSSPHGYRAIVRHAFGSSIPQLDPKQIGDVEIPWLTAQDRTKIARPVLEAWKQIDAAHEAERKAVALVERMIEAGAV